VIPAALGAGSLLGLGVFLLVWPALPATPAAGRALRRLHPEPLAPVVTGPAARWRTWWRPPHRELSLIGRTPRQYAVSVGSSALIGSAMPAALASLAPVVGVPLPMALPVAAGGGCAALFAWVAHRDVIARAGRARYEFRRAACSYLDLVSLELAAGHGPVASLERAAAGIDGWVFTRIRETLLRAQLQLHQPWDELRDLAAAIDVPELGDVGDIVHAAGTDGAVVHETLLARADSLRDQIRTEALARAKATTTKLDIPGAALLLVLAVFVIYPLLTRVG
jgi:tight adherence protein C